MENVLQRHKLFKVNSYDIKLAGNNFLNGNATVTVMTLDVSNHFFMDWQVDHHNCYS